MSKTSRNRLFLLYGVDGDNEDAPPFKFLQPFPFKPPLFLILECALTPPHSPLHSPHSVLIRTVVAALVYVFVLFTACAYCTTRFRIAAPLAAVSNKVLSSP